jgi:hypothetical protein
MPPTINNTRIVGIPSSATSALVNITQSTIHSDACSFQYRRAATPGFTDGSSGGPWFWYFNTNTKRGSLLGDTGGCQEGGPSSGSPSYAAVWRSDFSQFVAYVKSKE